MPVGRGTPQCPKPLSNPALVCPPILGPVLGGRAALTWSHLNVFLLTLSAPKDMERSTSSSRAAAPANHAGSAPDQRPSQLCLALKPPC
jgi:hypothetical protein